MLFLSSNKPLAIVLFASVLFWPLQPGLASENEPPPDQILDNSKKGALPLPPALRGPLPDKKKGLPSPAPLRTPQTPAATAAAKKLNEIVMDTIKSMGAMFVDPERITVQPPLLSALITVEERLSPFSIDAGRSRTISLHDVLNATQGRNLNIKTLGADSDVKRWDMVSSFGGFLPSLGNEITYQGLTGQYISPASAAITLENYYLNTNSGFQQYLYKGGGIMHTFREKKHDYRASKHAVKLITNDSLLETAKDYYKLALNEVLLQIRIKSVEAGSTLLLMNEDMYANGANTMLDVLQAKAQLARDRQSLIKQQIERRQSAVKLSTVMNEDADIDLTLGSPHLEKIRLIDKKLSIKDLLQISLNNRPELKRYEELRLAALESIKVARAPLLPQITFDGAVVGTFARIFDQSQQSQSQQTPFSTSGGAGVGAVSSTSLPINTSSTNSTVGRHDAGRSLFIMGVDMKWELGGAGLTAAAKVQAARSEARRRQLEFLRSLNHVYKEVRDAYLSSIEAENLIIETTDLVNATREQLRVAADRLENGVGTELDVVNAQRNYTAALVDKANAIIQFNTAQAELLRNIGRITVSTLVASTPLRQ